MLKDAQKHYIEVKLIFENFSENLKTILWRQTRGGSLEFWHMLTLGEGAWSKILKNWLTSYVNNPLFISFSNIALYLSVIHFDHGDSPRFALISSFSWSDQSCNKSLLDCPLSPLGIYWKGRTRQSIFQKLLLQTLLFVLILQLLQHHSEQHDLSNVKCVTIRNTTGLNGALLYFRHTV